MCKKVYIGDALSLRTFKHSGQVNNERDFKRCLTKPLWIIAWDKLKGKKKNHLGNHTQLAAWNKHGGGGGGGCWVLKLRRYGTQRAFSIQPKISEISVVDHMERTISIWSDRNVRDQLWRWSFLTGSVILVGRTEMSHFIGQNLCPQYRSVVSCLQEQ